MATCLWGVIHGAGVGVVTIAIRVNFVLVGRVLSHVNVKLRRETRHFTVSSVGHIKVQRAMLT